LRCIARTVFDDSLHVATFRSDQPPRHLEVFLVIYLDIEAARVLDAVAVLFVGETRLLLNLGWSGHSATRLATRLWLCIFVLLVNIIRLEQITLRRRWLHLLGRFLFCVVLAATAYTSLLAGVFAVAFLGGGRLLLLLSILLLFSACLLRLQIRVHVLYGDPLHAQDHVVLHQVMVVHSLLGEVGGDEVQVGHHSELFIVA